MWTWTKNKLENNTTSKVRELKSNKIVKNYNDESLELTSSLLLVGFTEKVEKHNLEVPHCSNENLEFLTLYNVKQMKWFGPTCNNINCKRMLKKEEYVKKVFLIYNQQFV